MYFSDAVTRAKEGVHQPSAGCRNTMLCYAHLLPANWTAAVPVWLAEDIPSFDYGGFVVGDDLKTATLYGKSDVCQML